MKRIIITGGAGFVGRRLTRRLLEAGHDVTVVDPIAALTGGIHPNAGWPMFDPRDFATFSFIAEDCRSWFARNPSVEIDEVFHLAALVGGRLMIETNPLAVAEDLAIDAMFWRWATTARPRKIVCFSSSAAYPVAYQTQSAFRVLSEDMIRFEGQLGMPDMTYGWAKLTCEYLARLAHQHHGLDVVCYRPFSGYGEDQDLAYPFPSICLRALQENGAKRLNVWGSGLQMRDFIHIEDCISGVLQTMGRVENGDAINLCRGQFTSFIALARLAAKAVGYDPDVRGLSDRPEGVFARAGDVTKLASLGFDATITLADGIDRGLAYLSECRAVAA